MIQTILENETNKWLARIEPIAEKIECFDSKGEHMLQNMKAYISDTKHFLEKKDYVRAFEAVVWAWAIYEICLDLGIFSVEQ